MINIYQIFYNETTRKQLDPGFIPLDNSENPRPDWFEFYVIRNFLNKTELRENEWYGFLSPNFKDKAGFDSDSVKRFIEFSEGKAEVALIPYCFDQIAYFQNPFEQGEIWHPGIMKLSQTAIGLLGFNVDLGSAICHSGNFTFSNFIIAKPSYWKKWLIFANNFYELLENKNSELSVLLTATTRYKSGDIQMKVFLQERIPFILILMNQFKTSTFAMVIRTKRNQNRSSGRV